MTGPTERDDAEDAMTPEEEAEASRARAQRGQEEASQTERPAPFAGDDEAGPSSLADLDPEATVNLTGDFENTVNLTGAALPLPERDDATVTHEVTRGHLKGLLEALVFASDKPIKANELAKTATAPAKQIKELLEELRNEYAPRGLQLDEVAGGWIFRTNAAYAPFVRDLTKQKPVKLTRAQIETLAILAYRQPITRPEVDEIRGVDCGPVLKVLLERDLVRILGKKDEPGRPWLYGTTTEFLEFFGLKSLRDLPTLREFTELNEESRRTVERELGETLESAAGGAAPSVPAAAHADERNPSVLAADTLPPDMLMDEAGTTETEIPPSADLRDPVVNDGEEAAGETAADDDAPPTPPDAAKKEGELDPEEEFPDDDDDDFDDDDDDEDEDEDEDD